MSGAGTAAPGTVWNRRQSCGTGVCGGNISRNVSDVAWQYPRRRQVLKDLTLTTGDPTCLLDICRGIAEGATDPCGSLSVQWGVLGQTRSATGRSNSMNSSNLVICNLNHINKTKQEWGESPSQLSLRAPPTSRHLMQVLAGTEGSCYNKRQPVPLNSSVT